MVCGSKRRRDGEPVVSLRCEAVLCRTCSLRRAGQGDAGLGWARGLRDDVAESSLVMGGCVAAWRSQTSGRVWRMWRRPR